MSEVLAIITTWIMVFVLFNNGFYDHNVRERYRDMAVEQLLNGNTKDTREDWEYIADKVVKRKDAQNETTK